MSYSYKNNPILRRAKPCRRREFSRFCFWGQLPEIVPSGAYSQYEIFVKFRVIVQTYRNAGYVFPIFVHCFASNGLSGVGIFDVQLVKGIPASKGVVRHYGESVERAPQALVYAYVESLGQDDICVYGVHYDVCHTHFEMLVAFDVLRYFTAPVEA